ncbi:MAG: pentapeptide repeat-containing protein [Bacteroidota bacterium]
MPDFQDPTQLELNNQGVTLRFKGKQFFETLIRGTFDLLKGKPSSGTLPSLLKSFELKSSKENDAYQLVIRSIMLACRDQIGEQLDRAEIGDQQELKINQLKLKYQLFDTLLEKDYPFNLKSFERPESFALIPDFQAAYQEWLVESFQMSPTRAEGLAREFKFYFGYAFFEELRKGDYSALKTWRADEINQEQLDLINRQKYQAQLKEEYYGASLGQEEVALADVYIEPNFLVLEKLLSPEKQQQYQENSSSGHFLRTDYPESIHHYFSNHFLQQVSSTELDCLTEQSRMLVLLGQPGHGKSSFCYRTAHDLLQSPDYNGSVHLIRLRETDKTVIQNPQDEFVKLLKRNRLAPLADWENDQAPSLLLLDGLDELCMSQSLGDQDIRELIRSCKRLTEDYQQLYIVITSRFNYLPSDQLRQEKVLILSLAVMDTEQQKELIAKYHDRTTPLSNLDLTFIEIVNTDDQYQHIKELVELPILLQMILMSPLDLKEAKSRASIYDTLFDHVLNRKWDSDGRLKKYIDENDFRPEHLRQYLAFLAYKIYQSSHSYLNRSQIAAYPETEKFIRRNLSTNNESADLNTALKDVLTSFYLKEKRKHQSDNEEEEIYQQYAVEFLHKSLYEYLCCEYLWTQCKNLFLDHQGEAEYFKFPEKGEKIQKLFAYTRLSEEMIDYLKEIIANDKDCHLELQKAMVYTYDSLLQYGGIYQYPLAQDKTPQRYTPDQQALHVFHGYWAILGQLRQHEINFDSYFEQDWEELFEQHLAAWDPTILVNNLGHPPQYDDGPSFVESLEQYTAISFSKTDQHFYRYQLMQQDQYPKVPQLSSVLVEQTLRWLRLVGAERLPTRLSFELAVFDQPDLANLYGIRLNLRGANLDGAYLYQAYLNGANLDGAYLYQANLNRAKLNRANLYQANLNRAKLNGAYLDGAYLYQAYLNGANLYQAYLSRAYLYQANLNGANLNRANLNGANLNGAKLNGAYLNGANLNGANLNQAYLSRANLNQANLSRAKLNGAKLNGANLNRANLNGAKLNGAKLNRAILSSPDQLNNITPDSKRYFDKHYILSEKKTIVRPGWGDIEGYEILPKPQDEEE